MFAKDILGMSAPVQKQAAVAEADRSGTRIMSALNGITGFLGRTSGIGLHIRSSSSAINDLSSDLAANSTPAAITSLTPTLTTIETTPSPTRVPRKVTDPTEKEKQILSMSYDEIAGHSSQTLCAKEPQDFIEECKRRVQSLYDTVCENDRTVDCLILFRREVGADDIMTAVRSSSS
jgi:hypothetical protein